MKILALSRLNSSMPMHTVKPKDEHWQKRVHQKQIQETQQYSDKNIPDLFTKGPSEIALSLKNKFHDFDKCLSKIQYYINRSGDNLDYTEKHRLNQAKEALYRAFNKELPKDPQG